MREDPFLSEVMKILADQIRETMPSMREMILHSGEEILKKSGEDLARWNAMLATGTISPQEYEWLVHARVSVVEMDGLKTAGLALARIDELKASIVQSITGAALRVVLV